MLAYCAAGDELEHGGESFPTESHVNHKLCFFFLLLISCVRVFYLHVYLCTMCVSDAYAGQKRVLSLLKLELSMLVTCHVAAKNGTQVLWKSSQYHYPLMHLSIPSAAFFF